MSKFEIRQTPCLLQGDKGLLNEMHLIVNNDKEIETTLLLDNEAIWHGCLGIGEQTVAFYIPEPKQAFRGEFLLTGVGEFSLDIHIPRRWEVHVIQLSHHDPGYTDIPSHVLEESTRWLKQAIDDMEAREAYIGDDRYRIVIEQTYTLQRFLDTANPQDRARMIAHIQKGDVEVTALYANLISEILSPEEMLRALYPSERIAKETGVPILTAEHNDIPGFSWGYCTALCRAGIKFFVPGLPEYYTWGNEGLSSFWDAEKIFGNRHPGAFWWESQEGDRILFWSNNSGCGGLNDPKMPTLLSTLTRLEEDDWPHSVLRWPVQSADRDNSPYTPAYADYIKEWNAKYAYPRLICSTETKFYNAFIEKLDVELPVYRGGVDGQDYPTASTSQMSTSAVARENHALYRHAEFLYTIARDDEKMYNQDVRLEGALKDMLMADEHAYGFTYPACKGHRASFWEHGVYAMRANADIHDVLAKSMASIADRVKTDFDGFRLTIFNTSGIAGNYAICAPLRDPDNCGTEIHTSTHTGLLRMYQLNTRMQVHPQDGFLEGKFILRDTLTGENIPYVLEKVQWDEPKELAGLRAGIGAGTNRMGFFENPAGTALEIHCTLSLPAYGYRTLELIPCSEIATEKSTETMEYIENEYYRIRFNEKGLIGITDLSDGSELFDDTFQNMPCAILVKNGNEQVVSQMHVLSVAAIKNTVESTLTLRAMADGVYEIVLRFQLSKGVDGIRLDMRIVKNEKPLQTIFLAFPFKGTGIRYQGTLFDGKPATMLLPGSHSDAIAVQDWVYCEGSDIVWNSANAPIVYLSHLWEGYISPAHRCVAEKKYHKPLQEDDFNTGYIYSLLTCNNFGTNFFPSQLSSANFTFTFAKRHNRELSAWGASVNMAPTTILTDRSRGELPSSAELLKIEGVRVLAFKKAEDKRGYILRLRNDGSKNVNIPIKIWNREIKLMAECDVLERDIDELSGNIVNISAGKMKTVRFDYV